MLSPVAERWNRIDRGFERFTKWLVNIAAAALIVVMVLAFIDVIIAKLFGSSIRYCTEMITYGDVPIAYLGMGYTLLIGQMTSVDILFGKFSHGARKFLVCLYDLAGLCSAAFLSKLAFSNMVTYYVKNTMCGIGADTSGFVLWPFVLVEAIAWLVLAVSFLFSFLRYVLRLTEVPGDSGPELIPPDLELPDESAEKERR